MKINLSGEHELLNDLFNEPNITATLKSYRIRWAGHVWRAEDQFLLTITKWTTNKSRPRGRSRQRWED